MEDVLLSNNFAQQVESGSIFKRDDIDYDHVLKITDSSIKFRKCASNKSEHTQKQATLQSLDKSRHYIAMKFSSQSNDMSGNLKTGIFFKSQEFHILKHSHEINYPACSVILFPSLKNIGFSNVLVQINNIPNVSNENVSTNNSIMSQEKIIRFDKKCKIITRKYASSCKGESCSFCHLKYSTCVISTHEIIFFGMSDIINECYFVKDSGKIETSNRSCRFLLHLWFFY